jgi:hypothetical protein
VPSSGAKTTARAASTRPVACGIKVLPGAEKAVLPNRDKTVTRGVIF